ncbi:MAG: hypothetical protein DRJ03_03275 [Chloroflexi bacterium]|nr:MAG: hypothetical protein DRJ03_03275 [Chloroflexota bacterium]
MPVQTTYALRIDRAYAGLLDQLNPHETLTRTAEAGDISFGLAVVQGTDPGQGKLATATAGVFRGITILRHWGTNDINKVLTYKENRDMDLVRSGIIFVKTEDACVAGDPVFFRHTAGGGGTILGSLRTDADTATADQISGAAFLEAGIAGAIVPIRLTWA